MYAASHNFSYYVSPVKGHSEPLNPRTHLSKLYSLLADGRIAATLIAGPTYSVVKDYPEFGPLTDVNEVDVMAVVTPDGALHISCSIGTRTANMRYASK